MADVEDLFVAMNNLRYHKKALAKYTEGDGSYFPYEFEYEEKVESALVELAKVFDALVNERVESALAHHGIIRVAGEAGKDRNGS